MADCEITRFYTPDELKDRELFTKLAELLDYVWCQREEDFKDVKFKYLNFSELTEKASLSLINEFGFSYISQLALKINADPSALLPYLAFISLYKGTRTGVETVLSLLGFTTAEVIEHWEYDKDRTTPDGDTLQKLEVKIDISGGTGAFGLISQMNTFFENYVYPKLTINIVVAGDLDTVMPVHIGSHNTQFGSAVISLFLENEGLANVKMPVHVGSHNTQAGIYITTV